jgi:hypothetical protein
MWGSYDNDKVAWTDARLIWAAIAVIFLLAVIGNVLVWGLLHESDGGEQPAQAGQANDGGRAHQGAGATGPHDGHSGAAGAHHQEDTGGTSAQDGDDEGSVASACDERWHQQLSPLRAADQAMTQWTVHISAMNKLVAGKISLAQATTFWNQTRKGAIEHIREFEKADDAYRKHASDCPTNLSKSLGHAARQCVRAARNGDHLITLAGTAIHTWAHHVDEMEKLRSGQISATQATQMWQMMWRAGQRQVTRYQQDTQDAIYLRCR